jgi:hypothetical protein
VFEGEQNFIVNSSSNLSEIASKGQKLEYFEEEEFFLKTNDPKVFPTLLQRGFFLFILYFYLKIFF